jgi:hypothetical protein
MAKLQLTAGIYARITYVRREDGTQERLGVERQVAPCRELARRKGWAVIEPAYEDNDLSAFSGKRRPGYEQLLPMPGPDGSTSLSPGTPTDSPASGRLAGDL